jgi:Tetracyclin repressor-like, C-terminal domain
MEVMLYFNGLNREPEEVDTGDLCRDLATVLSRRPPGEFDQARNRMMPTLIAYSAVHHELGQAWRHRVMEPARQCLKRVLRRGIDRGVLMALLLGPILYRHILHKGAPQSPPTSAPSRRSLLPCPCRAPVTRSKLNRES